MKQNKSRTIGFHQTSRFLTKPSYIARAAICFEKWGVIIVYRH